MRLLESLSLGFVPFRYYILLNEEKVYVCALEAPLGINFRKATHVRVNVIKCDRKVSRGAK